jgi:hypothetical protein
MRQRLTSRHWLCAQVAEDYRADFKLYAACKDDVSNLCEDADQGAEIECLVSPAPAQRIAVQHARFPKRGHTWPADRA